MARSDVGAGLGGQLLRLEIVVAGDLRLGGLPTLIFATFRTAFTRSTETQPSRLRGPAQRGTRAVMEIPYEADPARSSLKTSRCCAASCKDALAELWPELDIKAEAEDGIQAIRALEAHRPDVLFLDIQMPGLTGLDVARVASGRCHVVFVTAFDQLRGRRVRAGRRRLRDEAVFAGAAGDRDRSASESGSTPPRPTSTACSALADRAGARAVPALDFASAKARPCG